MDMAVDPELRFALHNETAHVRSKGRVKRIFLKSRWNRTWAWSMVSDNYDFAAAIEGEHLVFEPTARFKVKPPRIGGFQSAVSRKRSDPSIIIHARLGDRFRHDRVPVQREICPQRCPQENHIFDGEAVVLQQMDIGMIPNTPWPAGVAPFR